MNLPKGAAPGRNITLSRHTPNFKYKYKAQEPKVSPRTKMAMSIFSYLETEKQQIKW
jgi:hypothetical protein